MAETRVEGLISHEELTRRLTYDQDSGFFFWKDRYTARDLMKEPAGSVYPNGYRYIEINGSDYRCARLAWFYINKEWPTDYVDHINGYRADDRLVNLRLANNSQNQANRGLMVTNSSGCKGVSFDRSRNKWRASITVNGVTRNLGRYKTKEEAAAAYDNAALSVWGSHAKLNEGLLSLQGIRSP